jgi:hypothetical protein
LNIPAQGILFILFRIPCEMGQKNLNRWLQKGMYKQGSMPLPPVATRRLGLKPMLSEDFHPGDQELLMAADGELSARRANRVRAHLAACWDCRARMAEIEGTIADFARIHRVISVPKLPPTTGARAQLRARLAELATKPDPESGRWLFQFGTATRVAAYICGRFSLPR